MVFRRLLVEESDDTRREPDALATVPTRVRFNHVFRPLIVGGNGAHARDFVDEVLGVDAEGHRVISCRSNINRFSDARLPEPNDSSGPVAIESDPNIKPSSRRRARPGNCHWTSSGDN